MAELTILTRGVKLLSLFDNGHPVMTIPELAGSSGLPESTIYRYISTLKLSGFIEEASEPRHYRLGLKILELAQVVRKHWTIIDIALSVMQSLLSTTHETVFLTVPYGNKVMCIERLESHLHLKLSFEPGRTMPMHAGASAKVLMAFLDKAKQDRIIREEGLPRFTDNTLTDPDELKANLEAIRAQGYAISNQERDVGARGIAAPISDTRGFVIASLSIAGPQSRITEEKTRAYIELIIAGAQRITRELETTGWIL